MNLLCNLPKNIRFPISASLEHFYKKNFHSSWKWFLRFSWLKALMDWIGSLRSVEPSWGTGDWPYTEVLDFILIPFTLIGSTLTWTIPFQFLYMVFFWFIKLFCIFYICINDPEKVYIKWGSDLHHHFKVNQRLNSKSPSWHSKYLKHS